MRTTLLTLAAAGLFATAAHAAPANYTVDPTHSPRSRSTTLAHPPTVHALTTLAALWLSTRLARTAR